jgi:hypothetical protein
LGECSRKINYRPSMCWNIKRKYGARPQTAKESQEK